MKQRVLIFFVTSVLLLMSLCVSAQHTHDHSETEPIDHSLLTGGVDLYDWLGNDGYYTDDYSDKELQNFVAQGLESESAEIFSATVGSLAWYAVHTITQRDESGNPRFDRGLTSVPGLKQKLINYWRTNKTEDSYPLTADDVDNSVEFRNELLVLAHDFAWSYVPPTLAALFPKDKEVHAILWEGHDPENPAIILDWLNRGQFTTDEATEIRLKSLSSLDVPTLIFAAIGLGFTESEKVLIALVDRLERDSGDRAVRAHLIDSIVAHGERAISHFDLLVKAAKASDLLPPEGSTLVRPEGYGIGTEIGLEYRTQQALQKLEELKNQNSEEED